MILGSKMRLLVAVLGLTVAVMGLLAFSAHTWAQGEERITLKLRETDLDYALRLLFQDTPYSYTLAPGITGTVTVTLNDVTFSQALRAVLDLHGLTYRRDENVYVITRRSDIGGEQQPVTVSEPAAHQKVYWIGPGGRYELQFLDSRMVAAWFGGRNAGGDPIPRPLSGLGGVGMGGMGMGGMGMGTGGMGTGGIGTGGIGTSGIGTGGIGTGGIGTGGGTRGGGGTSGGGFTGGGGGRRG